MLAILGISAILAASAMLFNLVKYLGAAYLIFLGLQAMFAKAPMVAPADGTLPVSAAAAFRQAILAEVLNPKTALFFLAFLPQFVRPENGSAVVQLALLGLVFVAVGFFSTALYALCAGHLGRILRRNPLVLKLQGKAIGTIYCGLGIRLALQDRA